MWINQPVLLVCPRSLNNSLIQPRQTFRASMVGAGCKESWQTMRLHGFSCSQRHRSARSPWLTRVCQQRTGSKSRSQSPRTALAPLSPLSYWVVAGDGAGNLPPAGPPAVAARGRDTESISDWLSHQQLCRAGGGGIQGKMTGQGHTHVLFRWFLSVSAPPSPGWPSQHPPLVPRNPWN